MAMSPLKEAYRKFTTTVSFVTTNSSKGPNVMAAEWTFQVSYEPFLVAIHVRPEHSTHDAISESREFGVSLVAEEQVAAMAFAGHFTKRETDKLSSEFFETYPAKKINVPMIKGSPLNMECKLVQRIPLGDHTAFIGEVVEFSVDPSKKSVVYQGGSFHLGPRIDRKANVVVAVTPMESRPDSEVMVEGEFTSPERVGKQVSIALLSTLGKELAGGTVLTDEYGDFQVKLKVPADLHKGVHRIVAKCGVVEGGARLNIK